MKNNILLRTNLFVCTIIILGFIIVSIISYRSNMGVFEQDVEHVSDLSAEGIYYQIDSIFTRPVNVSQTMANDNLLKEFLSEEQLRINDQSFVDGMRDYLLAYREKYGYDSVFLVSAQTGRYYHYNGLDRTLTPGNPENVWYYDFLQDPDEYAINIDNDEAAKNEITIFINCKIKDRRGAVMGVVGVGFRVNELQALLKKYEDEFGVQARLVDAFGKVEISTEYTGYENKNLFDEQRYQNLKGKLFTDKTSLQSLWYRSPQGKGYLVFRYIENLNWYLIVENDTENLDAYMCTSLLQGILVITMIVGLVLFTITTVIRRYNVRIIELTAAREREYYETRQEAAKELYENIYELDITHNCAVGENTQRYFASCGVPENTPYDEALKMIAARQIKEEYRQEYVDTFSSAHVLEAYQSGIKSLSCDFMIADQAAGDYWMRIMACIYFWSEDSSVRMTTYHQNIDAEKQREKRLFEQMQSDPLTGLYNKAATEELISDKIASSEPGAQYAFLILDIDDFKRVNDTLGHSAGDYVIAGFARNVREQFAESDLVGRIGGDEFVVFLEFESREWLVKKAQQLTGALHTVMTTEAGKCEISASIGIAVCPEMGTEFETLYKNADLALYQRKNHGKNGFTIYEPAFRV